MDSSRITVDLRARTFEIEVPHDKVDAVLDRLEDFFSMALPEEPEAVEAVESSGAAAPSPVPEEEGAPKSPEVRKRSKGPSKIKAYDLVDLGLSTDQRNSFRDRYTEKNPAQQSDMVAVVGYLLKEFMNKNSFSQNEIHSAIKIVNKPTPKNLLAVFGNMKRDGIADYADSKVVINSLTEDYVNHHMASKVKKTAK